jgi:hypothetical protein
MSQRKKLVNQSSFRYSFQRQMVRIFSCLTLVVSAGSNAISDENATEKPGTQGNGNFIIGPEYKIDPDLTDLGNPKGKYFEFAMPMADRRFSAVTIRRSTPKKLFEPNARFLSTFRQPMKTARKHPSWSRWTGQVS